MEQAYIGEQYSKTKYLISVGPKIKNAMVGMYNFPDLFGYGLWYKQTNLQEINRCSPSFI